MGDEGRGCLGAYTPGARPVFMRPEKSGRESVADAEKLRYPPLPPANVQTLMIGGADPDPYSSDEETKYISLDKPIETGVSAARTNQSRPIEGPSTGVLRKKKNMRPLRM